jgi:transcriptional regulator with XRE-family HTH domain
MTGAELRSARLALGITQRQLARVLGVHPNTLACWERGSKPIGNPEMLRMALAQIGRRPTDPTAAPRIPDS